MNSTPDRTSHSSGAYVVSGNEVVRELDEMPKSLSGSPSPVVLANERDLCLAYLVDGPEPDWSDPSTIESLTPGENICVLRFSHARSHYFGPPGDESLQSHPLFALGLRWYGSFEVHNSNWIATLERMNSVHHNHNPARFKQLRHFAWSFHDSIFECVAEDATAEVRCGLMNEVISDLAQALG